MLRLLACWVFRLCIVSLLNIYEFYFDQNQLHKILIFFSCFKRLNRDIRKWILPSRFSSSKDISTENVMSRNNKVKSFLFGYERNQEQVLSKFYAFPFWLFWGCVPVSSKNIWRTGNLSISFKKIIFQDFCCVERLWRLNGLKLFFCWFLAAFFRLLCNDFNFPTFRNCFG